MNAQRNYRHYVSILNQLANLKPYERTSSRLFGFQVNLTITLFKLAYIELSQLQSIACTHKSSDSSLVLKVLKFQSELRSLIGRMESTLSNELSRMDYGKRLVHRDTDGSAIFDCPVSNFAEQLELDLYPGMPS